jgi:L-glutamine:2-deoxy-scyllo-inosose/3-amino-2,3-dideoxy-scyllo-inosose aminotransferase
MAKLAIAGGKPLAKLQAPTWPMVGKEEERRVMEVTRSLRWSYSGPMETAFNEAWAAFNASKYSTLVANGTVALQLAYEALDIGRGDEVLVPGSTWQATAAAALDVNAVPVLVDIDPENWCIDPKAAEAAITSRTRAIAAVHLYGRMADMDAIMDLASRHGLAVVEDCAHQHGSQWRGKCAGTIGDIGSFSHQESKVLTCGEGGSILTQDERLYGRLDQLRNCGRFSPRVPESQQRYCQSGNYRISEWQAAVLLSQLERLPEQIDRREATGKHLDAVLANAPGIRPLKRQDAVTRQSYYAYGFRFIPEEWDGITRRTFSQALWAETGIGFGTPYEPLNDCSLYQPHSKRRHRLDDEYWAKINPSRYELPVNERIAYREGVLIGQPVLLLDPKDMDVIGEGIAKLYKNKEALKKVQEES